jgi:phosphatidate cytidylyltransferase
LKNKVLKQRVITGAILAIIAILLIFVVPAPYFIAATTVILLLAAWEWSKLAGFDQPLSRALYVLGIGVLMFLVWHAHILPILLLAVIWWLFALYLIVQYPAKTEVWSSVKARSIMGVLVLVPAWLSINFIRAHSEGATLLFFMVLLICSADIGAYFTGKRWGKTKLMPKVSPGKSWQGFVGGLIISILVAIVGAIWLHIHFATWVQLILMVILVNIYSVTGDLLESMVKRINKVKDSGQLLPGHGGLLDRLDSMTAVAPIFLLANLLHFYK